MTISADSRFLVIIPARGGSKGIPRKNLRPLAGKPLITWTLDAVRQAETPLRCVVTTDDAEIAEVCAALRAEVVRRPAELATDGSATEPALLHVLETIDRAGDIEQVMLLQATSPVRGSASIDAAVMQYLDTGVDSIVGVVPASTFLWRGPASEPTALYDYDHRLRRQDITEGHLVYRETGSLYITSRERLCQSRNRISGDIGLFVMPTREGLDIDTEADFREAERLLAEGVHDAG